MTMQIKLTLKFVLTFMALTFVMHEAHEIAHTLVGRLICGCWGVRDFNVWETCESCAKNPNEIWSTVMGPVFTFIMVWIGANLLKQTNTDAQKSLGFSLIFANMPFARLLNPAIGGGDELVVLNSILKNYDLSRIIIFFLILFIVAYPLFKAYQTMSNKYKIAWFLGFFILPTFLDLLIVLGLMNTLLSKGVLAEYWILGSPILVTVWTAAVLVMYMATRKNIYTLFKTN
jgi:hypothetical protein